LRKAEKNDFLNNVAICVTERYGVDKSMADSLVHASVVSKLIQKMPEFVGHESIYSWAEEVWDEHKEAMAQ